MKSFQAIESLIRLKLVTADTIDMTVFNTINRIDSILVLSAILFIVVLSPGSYTYMNDGQICIAVYIT